MNLANKLTVLRILLVPIMVIIPFLNIQGTLFSIPIEYIVIDVIFVIAALTDKLDGYIARSKNQITTFGKFLDPIADKIVVITAMIMLVEFNHLPAWIPIIVIFREFIVSGYRLIAAREKRKCNSCKYLGKVKNSNSNVSNNIGIFRSKCLWCYF